MLLLGLNPALTGKPHDKGQQTLINFSPDAPEPSPAPSAAKAVRRDILRPQPTPLRTPHSPAAPKLPYVPLSKADMAAADISNLGSKAPKGDSSQSASADGAGEGPGGAHLYRAEWYVEPTPGQLAFYLPKKEIDRGSWAEIGCKTVAAYHVQDCILLGESPVGSGLARAMRSASWQFLVRPPRIDGKPMVGSWVRIHFDFSQDRATS